MRVQYLIVTFDIGHLMEVYIHIEREHVIAKLTLHFKRNDNNLHLIPDIELLEKLKINPNELEQTVLTYMKRN